MLEFKAIHIAWALLGLYLVAGLIVYERTGMRLGGVLVLPLLLVYALLDLVTLLIFAVATATTYLLGNLIIGQTLAYGRRALYLYLLLGLVATFCSNLLFGSPLAGFMLALLPGLYSYNLHREGTNLKGVSAFMVAFAALLVTTIVGLWIVHTGTIPTTWATHLPWITEVAAMEIPARMDLYLSVGAVTLVSAHEAIAEGAE
jgi:hypothetical protein